MPRPPWFLFASALLLASVPAFPAITTSTVDAFLGLCVHTVRFKPERYEGVVGVVRDYHPVSWDLGGDTSVPAPLPFAKNRVNWETVYGGWRKAGLRAHASLMFSNLAAADWENLERDARAYGEAFARMAGPGGRDWLEAVEIGNESGHYTDADFARLFDAMSAGIRAGDPRLKIATCNVTAGPESGKYDKTLELFRPFLDRVDIITVHSYAQTDGWPTWRRTWPEDPATPHLRDVRAVIKWRDTHAAGKPVWVTEFGWDAPTSLAGRKNEFARWEGNVSDAAQAAYLLRSIPLFMAEGVDRAHVYFFDDRDEPQLHGASGITRNGQPKPSWHALRQFSRLLGDARLERLDRDGPLHAARWRKADGAIWLMLWSAEADVAETAETRPLSIRPRGEAIPLALGPEAPATIRPKQEPGGRWSLPVGPRPIYIQVDG